MHAHHITPELLNSLITTTEAANLAGVNVQTIRTWKHRGHIEQVDTDKDGRPLFRWIDVARAERATRERARRNHAAAA